MARLRDSWPTSLPAPQQPRDPQPESIARNRYQYLCSPVLLKPLADVPPLRRKRPSTHEQREVPTGRHRGTERSGRGSDQPRDAKHLLGRHDLILLSCQEVNGRLDDGQIELAAEGTKLALGQPVVPIE